MLTLAGLRISVVEGGAAIEEGADLCLRIHRVPDLPMEPGAGDPIAVVRGEQSPAGMLTCHAFGYGGRVHCRFLVGTRGDEVVCHATPHVTGRDILSLFGEPILRTVLTRRGLISFHAACLSRDNGAILIMGDKGRGKSTLSSALQRRGWQLLADDLTRVAQVAGAWHAFPGLRQTKLLPEAAAALGHAPGTLAGRWDDPGPDPAYAGGNKLLLDPSADLPPDLLSVPLTAAFVLGARHEDGGGPVHHVVPAFGAVRALILNATPDPLDTEGAPPREMQRAVGSLVRSIPVIELALPDRLSALPDSAAAVEAIAANRGSGVLS